MLINQNNITMSKKLQIIFCITMVIVFCFTSQVRADEKNDISVIKRAAEQGDAEAQNNLASMYDRGEGVSQDYKKAVYWYTKAAEQGIPNAQSILGGMYETQQGVSQD